MTRSGSLSGVVITVAVSVATMLAGPPARAAGEGAAATPTPTTAPTGPQLAEQAYDLQASGKYADAIAMYLKAYELSRDALTLLNVATIYDRKLEGVRARVGVLPPLPDGSRHRAGPREESDRAAHHAET